MPGLGETPPATLHQFEKDTWFLTQWTKLIKCWILGDFLQATHFQNHIVDLLVSNFDQPRQVDDKFLIPATPAAIRLVWSSTQAGSSLRRITLDALLTYLPLTTMRTMFEKKEVPEEFLADRCEVGLTFSQGGRYISLSPPRMDDTCNYHIHTDSVPKGVYCNFY